MNLKESIITNVLKKAKIKRGQFNSYEEYYECITLFECIISDILDSKCSFIDYDNLKYIYRKDVQDIDYLLDELTMILNSKKMATIQNGKLHIYEIDNQLAYNVLGNQPGDSVFSKKYMYSYERAETVTKEQFIAEFTRS